MPVRAPRNERILLFSPKRAKAAPRFLEHLLHVIWSFVRFVRFVVTLCRGFYIFSRDCCSRARTSTHAAHAHRTTWRRFSTSATVRTRPLTRGARISLGTRP